MPPKARTGRNRIADPHVWHRQAGVWLLACLMALLLPRRTGALQSAGIPPAPVQAFDLLTPKQGWVRAGGRLYATRDAGTTWKEVTPAATAALPCAQPRLAAVSFADVQTGMAVLTCPALPGPGAAALARTGDRGASWSLLPFPAEVVDAFTIPTGEPHLQLLDTHTAWLVVDTLTSSNFSLGRLFATGDGGETWQERTALIGGPVVFANPQAGWAAGGAGGGELYRTTDGGLTWSAFSPSPFQGEGRREGESTLYQLPTLIDDRRTLVPVILATPEGSAVRLYTSSGEGQDWQIAIEVPTETEFSPGGAVPVAALDAERWLLLPGDDTLLRIEPSESRSTGWAAMPVSEGTLVATIRTLDMAGDRIGWALSQTGSCDPACRQETALLRTTDGGATWEQILPLPEQGEDRASVEPGTPGLGPTPTRPAAEQREGLQRGSISHTRAITGQGFDTCEAPSLGALEVWFGHSPYRTVNLYIGGLNRACDNVRLTPDYVEALAAQGWTFIPTWVGPQAACWGYPGVKMSDDPAVAYEQGGAEALAAVGAAAELGLAAPGEGTVIYFDLEAYNTGNAPCRQAAKSFIQGWTERLEALGQIAGGYGAGCASAPSDWAALPSPPDALWAAHWIYNFYTPEATVWDVACLADSLWLHHQRLRQYTGGHNETWDGTSLTIDCNVLDGIVADLRAAWSCEPGEPCWHIYLPGVVSSSGE